MSDLRSAVEAARDELREQEQRKRNAVHNPCESAAAENAYEHAADLLDALLDADRPSVEEVRAAIKWAEKEGPTSDEERREIETLRTAASRSGGQNVDVCWQCAEYVKTDEDGWCAECGEPTKLIAPPSIALTTKEGKGDE